MDRPYGLKYADAFSKSLEITKRDAERFPEEKGNFFSSEHICALSRAYSKFDPDVCFNKLISLETNRELLRSEMTFIIEIWLRNFKNFFHYNINLADRMRLMMLARKYSIDVQFHTFSLAFFAFPDIYCNTLINNPNFSAINCSLKEYKNLKDQHKAACYFGMLPSGKKYGGFVKAFVHLDFTNNRADTIDLRGALVLERGLACLRVVYNSTIISQEKRVEFFEKLEIKESDCILWSQNFDRTFPKYAHIHKLFGQVA